MVAPYYIALAPIATNGVTRVIPKGWGGTNDLPVMDTPEGYMSVFAINDEALALINKGKAVVVVMTRPDGGIQLVVQEIEILPNKGMN